MALEVVEAVELTERLEELQVPFMLVVHRVLVMHYEPTEVVGEEDLLEIVLGQVAVVEELQVVAVLGVLLLEVLEVARYLVV